MIKMGPAQRLAQALAKVHFTQAEIAGKAGLSEATVSRVKLGKNELSKRVARKLATVLPVSAHWLLFGEEAEIPAEGVAEEAQPLYDIGAGRRRVICATVHKCEDCRSQVEIGARICPGCGAQLIWPEDVQSEQPG